MRWKTRWLKTASQWRWHLSRDFCEVRKQGPSPWEEKTREADVPGAHCASGRMVRNEVRGASQGTWWTQISPIILIWELKHSVVDKWFWIISSSKLKKCQVLTAGTSKCDLLKKKCICGCYQGPWDGGTLVDYLGGPKMPSQVLLLERKREISHSQKRRKQCGQGGKDWSDIVTIQGSLVTPETGKGKERALPWGCHRREHSSADSDFKSVTLILNFWFPELWENKVLLF